ncbi:hypothetical protein ACIRG5_38750 [Lentzea sp. NPDC102401]|uniref:hypothetical protein n=1 Tax=Lentzea sp. NPDC102401 TaxID=3364128 RepID=UPI00381AC805
MSAMLSVDSDHLRFVEDDSVTVSLEFPWENGPDRHCTRCGEDLVETSNGYEDDSGSSVCDEDSGEALPHEAGQVPLSWVNSATIDADEAEDSVTVSISVGDPRGAFTFTLRRVPDDAVGDLGGRLVLHVPYPGEPCPHRQLTALHPGAFVVG